MPECIEVAKSQQVRLADVFVIGPLMVWLALAPRRAPAWAHLALLVAGLATILYNADNYLSTRRANATFGP
jgi:hypothetical protein